MPPLFPFAVLLAALGVPAHPGQASAGWQWPTRGPLLERFSTGPDPFAAGQHRGIDIAAPEGATVRSACPGRVRFAGSAGTSGRTVSVACGGLVASYLHLRSIAVREGESVRAGSRLGHVGVSGRRGSRHTHLHFGVRVSGRRWTYVDPLSLLADPATPAPVPVVHVIRRLPGPPGPPLRVPAPRARPSAVPVASLARAAAPAGAPPPSPHALPWTAWAGIGLIALGTPIGAVASLRGRSRRRRARGAAARAGSQAATT